MVDAVESLGEVRDHQRTNIIRFISSPTFVEHIKKLNQTVCRWGAFNAPILVIAKNNIIYTKDTLKLKSPGIGRGWNYYYIYQYWTWELGKYGQARANKNKQRSHLDALISIYCKGAPH